MYVLNILIISTTKRGSEHTNSQYFLAWTSPCIATFAKLMMGLPNQCICSQHDLERNWIIPKLPFQISLSNWELTKKGNLNISRQRTFAQKKIALFSCLLSLLVALTDWRCFSDQTQQQLLQESIEKRFLPNLSCVSHGVSKIPSSS